jgi:uncharacterized membrane protein YciS (DUF1049 family)
MEEFDQILKRALKEKAPAGFTDKLMDKLAVEQQTQTSISPVVIPGKKFLFVFSGLFGLAIFSAIYYGGASGSSNHVLNYFNQLVSQVHFQIGPTIKLLVFSVAAICLFLIIDYIFRTRKIAHI